MPNVILNSLPPHFLLSSSFSQKPDNKVWVLKFNIYLFFVAGTTDLKFCDYRQGARKTWNHWQGRPNIKRKQRRRWDTGDKRNRIRRDKYRGDKETRKWWMVDRRDRGTYKKMLHWYYKSTKIVYCLLISELPSI